VSNGCRNAMRRSAKQGWCQTIGLAGSSSVARNPPSEAGGIVLTAVVLLGASAFGRDLGLPIFVAGTVVTVIVLVIGRQSPIPVLKHVSWSVLPLVAGLFILVEGMNRTGVLPSLAHILQGGGIASRHIVDRGSWRRHRVEPHQQFADGADRRDHQPGRPGPATCHGRDPDRRIPRAKSFRDRLAGHHLVADSTSPRGSACRSLAILETWPCRDAASVAAGDARTVNGVAMSGRLSETAIDRIAPGHCRRGSAVLTARGRLRRGRDGRDETLSGPHLRAWPRRDATLLPKDLAARSGQPRLAISISRCRPRSSDRWRRSSLGCIAAKSLSPCASMR